MEARHRLALPQVLYCGGTARQVGIHGRAGVDSRCPKLLRVNGRIVVVPVVIATIGFTWWLESGGEAIQADPHGTAYCRLGAT